MGAQELPCPPGSTVAQMLDIGTAFSCGLWSFLLGDLQPHLAVGPSILLWWPCWGRVGPEEALGAPSLGLSVIQIL